MLLSCSPKNEEEKADAPAKPALRRLVGSLSIVEDYALSQKSGASFTTRKTVLQGKIDQLVEVSESAGTLNFLPEGGARLQMKGTVSETGHLSLDDPDSNSIVKTRGDSAWTSKLGDYELSIARSRLGIGDEIHLRFNTPMAGKAVVNVIDRNGAATDLAETGADMGLSTLEPDPSDRKPMFKRNFDLFPNLGEVPAEPFEKQIHEGIMKYPALFHLGVITSPGRSAWTYGGTKLYSRPGSETQWTEKIALSLQLVPQ